MKRNSINIDPDKTASSEDKVLDLFTEGWLEETMVHRACSVMAKELERT